MCKRLGIRMRRLTFRDPVHGMDALDRSLADGRVVGLQTSVFWLPYFPEDMRFHFNAHNLIVYGRDGGDYLISDPVFEEAVRCDRASLMKARFAKGALAARGLMYYPEHVPADHRPCARGARGHPRELPADGGASDSVRGPARHARSGQAARRA